MVRFGQSSVNFLVRRPILSLSALALLCLILIVWQSIGIAEDTHQRAAVDAASDRARVYNAVSDMLHRQALRHRRPGESAVAAPAAPPATPLRMLASLARRLNKEARAGDGQPADHPVTRIVAARQGLGLPVVQGHFELEAAQRFLNGRRNPYIQIMNGPTGRAIRYATPVRLPAGWTRRIQPAVDGKPRPLILQVITVPLPGWLDGVYHALNLRLLLLISGVGIGFCMVIFLLRRLNSLLLEGKQLAYMAVQRNEQLQSAVDNAHQANQSKTDFLAKMSHELRTPLNAIIGFSDIIRSPYGDRMTPEKRREYAHDIHASGSHLLSVINEILDISRIEAGRFDLEEERFALTELIQSAVRIVRDQAVSAKLSLDVRVAENAPEVWADVRALRQVLINLLANAIKFTDPAGLVSLLAYFDTSGRLLIAVSDSGMGIAPEDLDKVLQPFEQVESTMARKNYGTGLGLPIAKNIIERHGGLLHLESELHRGTTVTLILPAERLYWPQQVTAAPALLDVATGQPLAYAEPQG